MSKPSIAPFFPWCRVKVTRQSVGALENPRSVLFRVEPDERFRPRCHSCAQPGRYIHSRGRKFVRDLSLAEHQALLHIEYRKVWCDRCGGARMEFLEFVDPYRRVTRRLGAYAAALCAAGLSVEAVARHLELDAKTVKHFDKAALQAQYGHTRYDGLERIAVDEIAVKKGHHYMTVVLDYDSGRVVWMGAGRKTETLAGFFRQMPGQKREAIKAVALDMWEPYIECVKQWCPQADIVFDLFHVVKAFNKVIDKIRNEEHHKAKQAGDDVLKGTKYLFLRNWGKLRFDQRSRLREVLDLNQRLNTVYWLKDFLAYLWSYRLPCRADLAVTEWCEVARDDGHPLLIRFAEMLQRYRYGILNHCKHQIHTSKLEGVNNKIKVIKRTAYGFHDLHYFALKIKQAFPGQTVEESLN